MITWKRLPTRLKHYLNKYYIITDNSFMRVICDFFMQKNIFHIHFATFFVRLL